MQKDTISDTQWMLNCTFISTKEVCFRVPEN